MFFGGEGGRERLCTDARDHFHPRRHHRYRIHERVDNLTRRHSFVLHTDSGRIVVRTSF